MMMQTLIRVCPEVFDPCRHLGYSGVKNMTKVESIEQEIQHLSGEELAAFRRWYEDFDAKAWDREFDDDVRAGRLDELAARALQAHAAGKSTRL
jgi:hypothetical protein